MSEPLTEEYIATVVRDARRHQGVWTGTSGTLAAHCMRLVKERERMLEANREQAEPTVDAVTAAWEKYRQQGPIHRRVFGPTDAELTTLASPAEQLLETARETVRQRRGTYGPPGEHFAKTVAAINAMFSDKLKTPLTVADWAQIMILDKLARHQGNGGTTKTADTAVDLAGYAACLHEVDT